MMKFTGSIIILTTFAFSSCEGPRNETILSYVDPFIGTLAHGHVFPGATTPFGMVQLSPDNGTSGWDWCSGYHYSDSAIAGFSHTHLSGTGIGDLADILFLPSMEPFDLKLESQSASVAKHNRSHFSHDNESASPGFYSVELDNGVFVELTATPRTGLQRYTARRAGVMSVLVDLGFAINWDRPVDCQLNIDGKTLKGTRNSSGWAAMQYLNFASHFSIEPDSVIFMENGMTVTGDEVSGKNIACIAYFSLGEGDALIVKTGISAVDTDGAMKNMITEAENIGFGTARRKAEKMWAEHLSVIGKVKADHDTKKVFFTALYHSMIAPNLYTDADGRYRGTRSEERRGG